MQQASADRREPNLALKILKEVAGLQHLPNGSSTGSDIDGHLAKAHDRESQQPAHTRAVRELRISPSRRGPATRDMSGGRLTVADHSSSALKTVTLAFV